MDVSFNLHALAFLTYGNWLALPTEIELDESQIRSGRFGKQKNMLHLMGTVADLI
jgi:hypothetical protein